MAGIITQAELIATFLFGIVGDALTVITAQPLLLIPFAVGFIGGGIALFKKL